MDWSNFCEDDFSEEETEEWNGSVLVEPQVKGEQNLSIPSNLHDRCIIHIDIDCFYAQVEMNKNPGFRDRPIGVQQKNLVVTTNYAARKVGVPKSGWVQDLLKICPTLVLINGEDLHDYRKVSQNIFSLMKSYKVPVERLGFDENYLDVTKLVDAYSKSDDLAVEGHCYDQKSENSCQCGCDRRLKIASKIAKDIRDKLYSELSLTSSGGIAHNKLLAKMVGGQHKPHDQTTIFPCDVKKFMPSCEKISKIPGIGSVLCKTLKENNITTIVDLQQSGISKLEKFLDPDTSKRVLGLSFGEDSSPVKQSAAAKSIGLEDRFKGLYTREECVRKLEWLLDRLSLLLHEDGRLPSVIKVTVRDYFKDKFVKKFHKECRQCKVPPEYFKSLANSCELEADSKKKVLTLTIQLLEKVVEAEFHLTLMGLSVSGFVSPGNKQNIKSFFNSTSPSKFEIPSPKSVSVNNSSINTSSKKRKSLDAFFKSTNSKHNVDKTNSETFTNGTTVCKKQRLINNQDEIDVDVFNELPEFIQKEITDARSISSERSVHAKDNNSNISDSNNFRQDYEEPGTSSQIPDGWDPEVFTQLPPDIRQELMTQNCLQGVQKVTSSKTGDKKVNKESKNNIFGYFKKK